jgi:very-short-patch-repair endonuclease
LADTERVAKYHPARVSRVAPLKPESSLTERKLWNELRVLRDDGLNFRRRVPVDGHTVDFFCPRAGLVVMIEGQGEPTYEETLRRFVENHGFAIVHVQAADIDADPKAVSNSIFAACRERGQALYTVAR